MSQQAEAALERESLVVRDPDILGGKPTIAGTRIGVHNIVAYVRVYHGDFRQILNDFPQLRMEQLTAALAYFASHPTEIEEILNEQQRFYEAGLATQKAVAANPGG